MIWRCSTDHRTLGDDRGLRGWGLRRQKDWLLHPKISKSLTTQVEIRVSPGQDPWSGPGRNNGIWKGQGNWSQDQATHSKELGNLCPFEPGMIHLQAVSTLAGTSGAANFYLLSFLCWTLQPSLSLFSPYFFASEVNWLILYVYSISSKIWKTILKRVISFNETS